MRVMALLLLIAAPALAQTPPPVAPGARATPLERLKAADANKDGKWNKAEWVAGGRREKTFDLLDANKDGFVTPEELQSGMDRLRAMGLAPPE